MGTELTNGGVKFGDGSTQSTASTINGWNVTYTSVSTGNGGSWSLPANCIGIYVWARVYGGSSNGGTFYCQVKNSTGGVLGTVYVHGTNDGAGKNDGGSGMSDSGATFIPLPTNAASIYTYTSNNDVGGSFYVQAYVTK